MSQCALKLTLMFLNGKIFYNKNIKKKNEKTVLIFSMNLKFIKEINRQSTIKKE